MAKLCIYLPPFASDYTGACSVLFDLDCMTAINDAGCCTEHYVFCDEPRWEKKVRPVFCTTIRNIDAVLGNDNIILDNICRAAEKIQPSMLALVGTPVPAITGMDMDGMACELEARTGRPAIGFSTTGFAYYDSGMARAGIALIDRFAEDCTPVPGRINLVGLTPLDYGDNGTDICLTDTIKSAGFEIGCRFFMGMTLEQLSRCGSACCNLAVSGGGLAIAKYLKKRFGTPYAIGFPFTQEEARRFVEGRPQPQAAPPAVRENGHRILLITDQILGCSLRSALRGAGCRRPIDLASFFGWDSSLAEQGDCCLKDEISYIRLLKTGLYDTIIADPLLTALPAAAGCRHISLVHPAVSGKLKWHEAPCFNRDLITAILEQLQ